MKTAISISDPLFTRVTEAATRHGMSRSAFFASAAERYLEALDASDLTARIDAAVAEVGDPRDEGIIRFNRANMANALLEDW